MDIEVSSKYKILVGVLALFIFLIMMALQVYDVFFRYHITAKFTEAGPLSKNISVYYRGYEIGKTQDVQLSSDYKSTLVKILIYPKNPKLPKNIIAKIKKCDVRRNYIELVEPEEPSDKHLKNGDTIEGEPEFDLEAFLNEVINSGMLNPIIDNISNFLASVSDTSDKMGTFFENSNIMVKDNKQNLKQTTKSLKDIATKINNSFSEDDIRNTSQNVNKSSNNILTATENIKNISTNVDNATKNLDKTKEKIDLIITDTSVSTSNIKKITCGLHQSLMKKFALLKLFFGRPIKPNNCQTVPCK